MVAGTALAACGSSAQTSAATTTTASKAKATGTKTVAKPVVNASNGSPGFNASKTVFVLPHKLGDLPAPELAFAKSDPAYAAGLLTPADWMHLTPYSKNLPASGGWIYLGADGSVSSSGPNITPLVNAKTSIDSQWGATLAGITHFSTTASVPILDSRFNSVSLSGGRVVAGQGYTLVAPSVLEFRAAPIGTLSVKGASVPAICIPSPIAVLQNGHIVTPGGMSLTAGPNVVITVAGQGAGTLYDQGLSSCAGFN